MFKGFLLRKFGPSETSHHQSVWCRDAAEGDKMWRNIQYCLSFALLLMVALATPKHGHKHKGHPSDHHHDHGHHGKAEHHPSLDRFNQSYSNLAPHNADFAFSLYKKLKSHADAKGKNIFFSPLSISTALSMLALGAKGETHSQIFSTLGYSDLTPDQVNEGYEHLLHLLGHGHDAMLLEMGGALAIREGFKPVDQFLKDIQHFYHGQAFSMDFNNPEVAAQEINKFIAKKTNDTITEMVKDLDRDTVMMLINYIYFKGKWEKPFEVERTHKADFHVDKNTKVIVDMMTRTSRYKYYRDQENFTSIIMVPYKGNSSLMVVLPDEGKMDKVESNINREQIKNWQQQAFRMSVRLSMPKFSISSKLTLDDALKELGIADAFSDHANFSGISEDTELKASKVLHQTILKVDERGTEAAGVTTIKAMLTSKPPPMNVNRPFLVLIIEESSQTILFMGKIINPNL